MVGSVVANGTVSCRSRSPAAYPHPATPIDTAVAADRAAIYRQRSATIVADATRDTMYKPTMVTADCAVIYSNHPASSDSAAATKVFRGSVAADGAVSHG